MSEALVALDHARMAVVITPAAIVRRDLALEKSALIGKVKDEAALGDAATALAALQTEQRECEKARKLAKQPVIDYGKKIEFAFEQHVATLESDIRRIQSLISGYQQEQRLIREREAQARAAEELRLREEEQERLTEAKTAEEVRAVQERFEAKREALPVVAEAPQVKGLATQEWWFFEICDPMKFFRAQPGCCKIELLDGQVRAVVANQAAMNGESSKWKAAAAGERVEDLIPGLRIWKGVKTTTRSGRIIDV